MSSILGNNYSNPLDNFRSYSYHYILTVANTTEAFRKMVEPKNGQARVLSAVENVQLGGAIELDGTPAYLLLDTRRFSQYSITEVEMEHIYGTGDRVNPSVPISSTRVKLIDTTGLTFFNFLADTLRNKLQTTRMSAFFLMTIMFVGHRDDGTTEMISTCNIPLIMLLMGFEFTSNGSIFDIEFMETEGATKRGGPMEQVNFLGNVQAVTTLNAEPTVGAMLQNLERELNISSLAHYQKYQNEALAAANKKPGDQIRVGKLVQYMITYPNTHPFNWGQFPIITATPSEREELLHLLKIRPEADTESAKIALPVKELAKDNSTYYQLAFSKTTTITDAIKKILETSIDFLRVSSRDSINAGNGYSFKTITNITSNENTYLVHFDIYPVKIPKPQVTQTNRNAGAASDVKNLIHYDYIFTGFNSHIRELKIQYMPESAIGLDMEVDIGSNRFGFNASNGNTEAAMYEVKSGKQKTTEYAQLLRPGDPVFRPQESQDQQKNNAQSTENLPKEDAIAAFRAKQEYTRNLAYFHFLSSMNIDMTIRGNPNLLIKYADREERGGIAPHGEIVETNVLESLYQQDQALAESNYLASIAGRLASAKSQYIANYYQPRLQRLLNPVDSNSDELVNGVDVATHPIFVSLNIRAPNVDFTGQFLEGEPMFTDEFFFKGPYMVMFVKHQLIDGEFTQNMNLIPFDISGTFSESSDSGVAKQPNTVR